MIQTKIATLLLVTAIAAPSLYGAEYRPKSRIPALVAQQPQAVGELRLEAGGNDKTLLLAPGTAPHIMKLPFDSKGVEKVESKTLLWRPEDGQDFMYAINPDAEPPAGPWLGVHVAEVSDLVASQLGLSPGMGLAIQHIVPESPAAKAGLRQHDILTKLDDQTLINSKQLVVLVRSKKSGKG